MVYGMRCMASDGEGWEIKSEVEGEDGHGRNDVNGGVDMRNEMNHDLQLVSFCSDANCHCSSSETPERSKK